MSLTDTISGLVTAGTGEPDVDPVALADIELDADDYYDILSNSRRRHVLQHLDDTKDGHAILGSVTDEIAEREFGEPDEERVSGQERKRVYIALYQNHLPAMHDAGIIDYDSRGGDIRLTDLGSRVIQLMHQTQGGDWT